MKIKMMWMTSILLLTILCSISLAMQKKNNTNYTKKNFFECGFSAASPQMIMFSIQFFMIALLFLIFDVEIAILLSYPMEMKTTKNLTMIILFLAILMMGLLYEWQKGKINWSN